MLETLKRYLRDGWAETQDSDTSEIWTYASADDPTYTVTVAGDKTSKYHVGMKVKLTQTTVKYFIITKISYSSPNTTITLYGGTDYDLANATISEVCVSSAKAPRGFPTNPNKWTVEVTDTTDRATVPTQNVWYNLGSLSISVPIGEWDLSYKVAIGGYKAPSQLFEAKCTLSTANNSESDSSMTGWTNIEASTSANVSATRVTQYASKIVTHTSKTTYYLNALSGTASASDLRFYNSSMKCVIRARCVYV